MTKVMIKGHLYTVLEWHRDLIGAIIGARVIAPDAKQLKNSAHKPFDVRFDEAQAIHSENAPPLLDGGFSGGRSGAILSTAVGEPEDYPPLFGGGFSGGGYGPALDQNPNVGSSGHHVAMEDGRYAGGNQRLVLDLRVDFAVSAAISGDLFGTDFGTHTPLASFRTAPGVDISATGTTYWPAIFETPQNASSSGRISLRPTGENGALLCRLKVDSAIPGLPINTWVDLPANWTSPYLRQIGIEVEQEIGTNPPPVYEHNSRKLTYQSVMRKAGFDVVATGRTDTLQKPSGGWGNTQTLTALLDQIAQWHADVPIGRPAWQNQLLWLDRPSRQGLLGVMFDVSAQLPRQGSAVFEGEVRAWHPQDSARRIIRTTAHEIGHALNLVHRFERNVGRADSLSIMNYDHRYRGGHRAQEYWEHFAFEFDDDELGFLRHGARHNIIPGGSAFHSINYWSDGTGGHVPYVPQAPLVGWDLKLSAPTTAYRFGQPVYMKVDLVNQTGRPVSLDRRILDPKGDFLSVFVKRVSPGTFSNSDTRHFHPIIERCFDEAGGHEETIPAGKPLTNNIQITYGSSGFTFAEPGIYDIRVIGVVPDDGNAHDPSDDRELIVVSNTVRIRVQPPYSSEEEEEAASILHRPDVGTYFAMGGAYALENAHDDLRSVCARRMGRRTTVNDPIVAAIMRCQAIDAGRSYTRTLRDGTKLSRDGDSKASAALLKKIVPVNIGAFDQETLRTTNLLLKKHEGK